MSTSTPSFAAAARVTVRTLAAVRPRRPITRPRSPGAIDSSTTVCPFPCRSVTRTVVELSMAPGDLGRVIGRQGRTAAAIRTLVTLAAELDGTKATVDFRDE